MLNLNTLNIDINKALSEHISHISAYTDKKLDEIKLNKEQADANNLIIEFLLNFPYNSNTTISKAEHRTNSIKSILGSKPEDLRQINKDFKSFVDSKAIDFNGVTYTNYMGTTLVNRPKLGAIHDFFIRLGAVFSYDAFGGSSYSKYKLTENLNVRTCVYCNRLYAITHYRADGGNLMNPQLDHWLPKSKYPLLQVSFFNLIPSCDICNMRIKKVREFKENDHVHPYDPNYEPAKFTYILNSINNLRVVFENDGTPNKFRDTFSYLNIHEMYNAHIPELRDLIKIKEAYGLDYMLILDKSFPSLHIKPEDRYRLAFGVELDPKNFHLSPLSKFKYDILKGLEII